MQGDRGKPTACFTWPEKLKKPQAASFKQQATSSLTGEMG
jgi:hypothetical protein